MTAHITKLIVIVPAILGRVDESKFIVVIVPRPAIKVIAKVNAEGLFLPVQHRFVLRGACVAP